MLNSQYQRQRAKTLIRHYPAVAVPRRRFLYSIFATHPAFRVCQRSCYSNARVSERRRGQPACFYSYRFACNILAFFPLSCLRNDRECISSQLLPHLVPGRGCEISCSRTEVTRLGNSLDYGIQQSLGRIHDKIQEIAIGCIFKQNKSFFVMFVKNNMQWSESGFSFSAALLRKRTAFKKS